MDDRRQGGGGCLSARATASCGALWAALWPPALALALGLGASALIVAAIGESPAAVLPLLFRQGLGSGDGFARVLFDATPLIFTGLSVAYAFRAGLFNIGAEGQLYIGAFAAAALALALPGLPRWLALPAAVAAAALGGALWGAIPGWLRARFGVHEVINTIMLNFIAVGLTGYLVERYLKEPGQMIPHTPRIAAGYHLHPFADSAAGRALGSRPPIRWGPPCCSPSPPRWSSGRCCAGAWRAIACGPWAGARSRAPGGHRCRARDHPGAWRSAAPWPGWSASTRCCSIGTASWTTSPRGWASSASPWR